MRSIVAALILVAAAAAAHAGQSILLQSADGSNVTLYHQMKADPRGKYCITKSGTRAEPLEFGEWRGRAWTRVRVLEGRCRTAVAWVEHDQTQPYVEPPAPPEEAKQKEQPPQQPPHGPHNMPGRGDGTKEEQKQGEQK